MTLGFLVPAPGTRLHFKLFLIVISAATLAGASFSVQSTGSVVGMRYLVLSKATAKAKSWAFVAIKIFMPWTVD